MSFNFKSKCIQCTWSNVVSVSGLSILDSRVSPTFIKMVRSLIVNEQKPKRLQIRGGLVSLTCRVIWMHVPFHSKFQKWRQFHLFTTHAHRRVQEKVNSTQVCKLWLRTKGAIKWFVYNYVMFLKYLCGIFCICVQFDIFLCAFSLKNLTLIDFKTKFLKVKMCEWHFF